MRIVPLFVATPRQVLPCKIGVLHLSGCDQSGQCLHLPSLRYDGVMWYSADDFPGVCQEIFSLEECDAVGDFYDLCLFGMHEEAHVSCDALDVFAQVLEILFVRMQDDTVIHIRIIAMYLPDSLAICIDARRKKYSCNLRERRADAERLRQEFLPR